MTLFTVETGSLHDQYTAWCGADEKDARSFCVALLKEDRYALTKIVTWVDGLRHTEYALLYENLREPEAREVDKAWAQFRFESAGWKEIVG